MRTRPRPRSKAADRHVSTTRVEKHQPKKARHEFSAWFYRVATRDVLEGIEDVDTEKFDEDLSELEEKDEDSDNADCEQCDGDDSECECWADGDSADAVSERSHNGSDAEFYYELKEMREERKVFYKGLEKEKQEQIQLEKSKMDEVNAAWEAFKKANQKARKQGSKIPLDSIAGKEYILYSKDYAEFCNYPVLCTKRLDFHVINLDQLRGPTFNTIGQRKPPPPPKSSKAYKKATPNTYVEGMIYLDEGADCQFEPPPPPTHANTKSVVVKADGKNDFHFISFSNQYVKLSIPRAFLDNAYQGKFMDVSKAPAMFEFVGVLRDFEKEKRERKEWLEKEEEPYILSHSSCLDPLISVRPDLNHGAPPRTSSSGVAHEIWNNFSIQRPCSRVFVSLSRSVLFNLSVHTQTPFEDRQNKSYYALRQDGQEKTSPQSPAIGTCVPPPGIRKHLPPKADRDLKFPAWYYRVRNFEIIHGRDPEPEHFDEDLSELEEEKDDECPNDGNDSECDCAFCEKERNGDEESEDSFEGSDAEEYYRLKEDREDRKRELVEERRKCEGTKKQVLASEKAKEEEVNAAYELFKNNGQTPPLKSLVGRFFDLYSTDYIEFCGNNRILRPGTNWKRVFFNERQQTKRTKKRKKTWDPTQKGENKEKEIYGDIFIDAKIDFNSENFRLPKLANPDALNVKGKGGKRDLHFTFFDNKYLKMSVPQRFFKRSLLSPDVPGPEIFEFVGIFHDHEKERRERQEEGRKEYERRYGKRSASPKDNYFNNCHPMGAFAQSRW